MSLVGDYGALSDDETLEQGAKRSLEGPDEGGRVVKRQRTHEAPTSSAVSQADDLMLDADFFGGGDAHKTTATAAPVVAQAKSGSAARTTSVASSTPDKPKRLNPPRLRSKRPNVVTEDYNAWKLDKGGPKKSDSMKQ